MRLRSAALVAILSVTAVAPFVSVFSEGAARAQQPAVTAEALFNEAKKLMAEKRYAEACPKFQASYQLDPAVGALLNLAVCFEKNGQTASAWATYKDVATAADASGQTARATMARQAVAKLEPLLARLTITVDTDAQVEGLEIKRDKALVPSAAWGTGIPIDPGDHVVVARAPKRKASEQKVHVADKEQATVRIAALEKEPEPPPPPPSSSEAPPPPPPPSSASATATPPSASSVVAPPPPPPPTSEKGELQRTLGSAGVILGTLGVTGGGILVLAAKLQYDNSNSGGGCQPNNQCNSQGLDKRNTAFTLGNVATISLGAGGILLATGIVLLITAPKQEEPPRAAIHVAPAIGPGGAGVAVHGSF